MRSLVMRRIPRLTTSRRARTLSALMVLMAGLVALGGHAGEAVAAGLPGGRPAPLAATIWLVCASGCGDWDHRPITAAVNPSSSGDAIHVAEGIYNETVNVQNKSLTILGGYSTNWGTRDPQVYETIIDAESGRWRATPRLCVRR